MSEIEYTVSDDTIQVTIDPQLRGRGAWQPSGGEATVVVCSHFPDDPEANPIEGVSNIGGRYESGELTDVYPTYTAQINQAGNYIFGWFQADFLDANTLEYLEPVTGSFTGKITRADGCDIDIQITSESGRVRPPDAEGFPGRITVRDAGQISLVLGGTSENSCGIHIPRTGRGMDLEWVILRRTSPLPRIPDHPLSSIANSNPVLFAGESHPLRSGQVEGMRRFLETHIRPKLDSYRRRGLADSLGRLPDFHAVFNFMLLAFRHRVFIGGRIERRCRCRCHSDARADLTSVTRLFECDCFCSSRFSSDQDSLAKAAFLFLLETMTIPLSGSEPISYLELLYHIGDDFVQEPEINSSAFARFRQMFRVGGRDWLPEHLGRYKYVCSVEYTEISAALGHTGINLAGRRCAVTITRHRREGGQWVRDGTGSRFRLQGALGSVSVEPLSAAQRARQRRNRRSVQEEIGVQSFEFETSRRWVRRDFPGYWEIFAFCGQVRWGGATAGTGSASVTFRGRGELPPLIAELQNFRWQAGSLTRAEFEGRVGFRWMPGSLWSRRPQADDARIPHHLLDLPVAGIRWRSQAEMLFETDRVTISESGRDNLGIELARNLVIFLSRTCHLRVDGHASRRFHWHHNIILSIRRAQFTLQAMVDILGNRFQIPLSHRPPHPGDGSTRLFAYGEGEAFLDGRPEDDDSPQYRRVDISANGEAVLRFTYSSESSE